MDPDHLDIYGTGEEVEKAFVDFSKNVKANGCLITKYGLSKDAELKAASHIRYSFDDKDADVCASNLKVDNGSYVFDIISLQWTITNVTMHMGGLHNIENVIAAVAVAKYLKIDEHKIRAAVEAFKGVRRRFEYALKNDRHVLIDDYAHHPEELRALITGVRSLFKQKLTIVFQPHLYSRTKDQADGFAEVLDKCDEVIILPIYPARELPMEGVNSDMIIERMQMKNVKVLSKEELLNWVEKERPELLVMAGAGDIDVMVNKVKNSLIS